MKVGLQSAWNDENVDAAQAVSQRQLSIAISAIVDEAGPTLPLNLCLILDHSGSMGGRPMETVKLAAQQLVDRLGAHDRLSIIAFDHKAKVLVSNQSVEDAASIKLKIMQLRAGGGTAIDEGIRLGIEELAKGKRDTVSQGFLLTDGENEHGDNDRCLKLAKLAASYSMTLNSLGFGDSWNQDILEKIADEGGGTLAFIERPEQASDAFSRLFSRLQSVGLTNAYLLFTFVPGVRFAELKPVAQVSPDTIELSAQAETEQWVIRLGDLMTDVPRVVLANLYLSQLPPGSQTIGAFQVRYDDPATGATGLLSESVPIEVNVQAQFQSAPNEGVQQHILALAKYRQTQIAETKLQQGDRSGAATMLQTAAKTAIQMGDDSAATVLQNSATLIQAGENLSEADLKKTRIVSKTILQGD
jgi:Ca-activated chloride channel homolog